MRARLPASLLLLLAAPVRGGPPLARPPETPKRPIAEVHHGVRVVDDYRWLEKGADPAVRAWAQAQNRRARAFLDGLPDRAAIHRRVEELERSSSVRYADLVDRGRGGLFALKVDPKRQQPMLVVLRSADDPASERVVLDPNALDPRGNLAIDFYVPSPDGTQVALSLSRGGSESGDLHFYDVGTAAEVGEPIPRVNGGTAGGSAAWNADGTGVTYTRYPRPGERPQEELGFWQELWFHRLGTAPSADAYELGKEFPRIAEIGLASSEDGRWLLADVKNGDGGEHAFYLRRGAGGWSRVSTFQERAVAAAFGRDGHLYLLSRRDAPRGRILRVPLEAPALARAQVVVPEGPGSLTELAVTGRRLYVSEILGGPSRLLAFDLAGKPLGEVPTLPVSTVSHLTRLEGSDDILFQNTSYLVPPAWYRLGAGAARPARTALFQTSIADFSDAEVVRDSAVSKDGTKVPLSVLRRKGTRLDGRNPTLLTGYGGYAISQVPRFAAAVRLWLDQGGVYAVASIRGGGEFGEEWHRDGMLTKKQNDYDDFYACARRLVEVGYTTPKRLAIVGGSNGGLLMGAALTQHPEQYRAVVSYAGVCDMLRVETTPNGAFNTTEYGSVKDPAQFRALLGYSPLHRVVDGAKYPAVLLIAGDSDPRVEPWHSRKFAARLQAASASGLPVLLRTSSTGHGVGTPLDERIAWIADQYAFLLRELGVHFAVPRRTAEL